MDSSERVDRQREREVKSWDIGVDHLVCGVDLRPCTKQCLDCRRWTSLCRTVECRVTACLLNCVGELVLL
jgi:hypothetical protein